ncbi:FkbM family methyltransferase [Mucilaginibacter sp. UYCu711]|uniref:FkbM family methyltransferase n=1 Tax=Mucilaginibacter sp. UYCu711 TaxID=3156339 RepID=UPI003D1A6183
MYSKLKFFFRVIDNLGVPKGLSFLINRKLNANKMVTLPGIPHPIFTRPGTSDEEVLKQIFFYNEYDFKLNFEPRTIIDGGANIGLSTIYFANKYTNAKIIAIEPDSGNVGVLKQNVEFYDNVAVVQAGIWSKKAKIKISDKYGIGNWGFVLEECDNLEDDQTTTETVNIADIMAEYNFTFIDLLKLDIETAEKQVFSENYMSWLPKTRVVVIELHDWLTKGCSKPFFTAINNAFNNYTYKNAGENVLIINEDLR